MSYWSDRVQKEREVNDAKSIAEYQRELESLYRLQLSELRKELESYIQRYADKEGVTTSEARKRADSFDIKAFEDKAKKYVEEKDFSAKANRELRDYNFSMSVERQELLIQSLELELTALADAETKLTRNFLENGYKEEIARGGLLSQSVLTGEILQSTMKAAVDANFQGAKWSDRIWTKQNQLKKLLATEVTRALIRGDNGTVIARKIRKMFDVSVREARRLAITELTRVQTMAQKYTMERNGFTHFILMPEGRACETCKQIGRDTARNPVPIEDMEIGLNAPPIHPHCRCAVAEEYVESGDLIGLFNDVDKNQRRMQTFYGVDE